jgi:hypothetical protein
MKITVIKNKPFIGDYFSIPVGDRYAIGRIVDHTDENHPLFWQFNNCHLTFIIDRLFTQMEVDQKKYVQSDTFLPPDWTNAMGWTKKFFTRIPNSEPFETHTPTQYSFKGYMDRYYDQDGNGIEGPKEICGDWGVVSYRLLISKAESML